MKKSLRKAGETKKTELETINQQGEEQENWQHKGLGTESQNWRKTKYMGEVGLLMNVVYAKKKMKRKNRRKC
jgi:hypothetical protein